MGRKLVINALVVFLCMVNAVCAQELTVITEDYHPINFVKDGKITGSSAEVVKEILRRLKLPENIRVLPWARGYNILRTQQNVVLFSTARTEEREKLFQWVGPLCTSRNGFYAKKGSGLRINSLEDAKKVRSIAIYKEDAREQMLKTWGFTNLDSSKSAVSNLRKILSGRADLWFYDNLGLQRVAEAVGVDATDLELVYPVIEVNLYIAFSRATRKEVVAEWQKTLNQMMLDGTFQKISKNWLPADSIPTFQSVSLSSNRGPAGLQIYTEDSPPGSYMDKGKISGMSVEVVQEISRRLEMKDNIQIVPWARGYTLALNQPNVALFSTTRLPQREKHFKWVGPLYIQNWGFYGRRGAGWRINSLEDAKKVARIGTYHRDAKEQFLRAKGFKNLVSVNKNISNIKHILAGDIDLWVSSNFNMPYLARQAGVNPDQLELFYAFHKVENYIAFSIQTADDIVGVWQKTLDEIKKEGIFARIGEKYGYFPIED